MSKTYELVIAQPITGFASEQEATEFIANTLKRWDYAVQSINGNKIDLGIYDIGINQSDDNNTFELQVYTSRPPYSGGTLYDFYETLLRKLVWQASNKTEELEEYRFYDKPTSSNDYTYDNWIPINTYNFDWFDTDAEYTEFFASTLNRWAMPTIIDGNAVICNNEGFKLTIVPSSLSVMSSRNIHEVTMSSNGKHILSMLEEIMDCLCVQANADHELTEDEAFEQISVEFKDMTEQQVQNHMRNSGQEPRDEINEWAQEYSGICDEVKRVSFCTFVNAVINVSIKNSSNIYSATFSDTMFSSASVLENITFAHCTFDNVVFDGVLSNVTFENCVIKSVSWPSKKCSIQIINA